MKNIFNILKIETFLDFSKGGCFDFSLQFGSDGKGMCICENFFFFFDLHGVSGPACAHHDYSPWPTEHPASPGAGKAPRG